MNTAEQIKHILTNVQHACFAEYSAERRGYLQCIEEECIALTKLPKEPPPALLYSMAMRYRHDFGLDHNDNSPMSAGCTPAEREAIILLMRQLYEEVAGYGFYQPKV